MNRDQQRKNEEAEPTSVTPSEDLQGKPNCIYHAAGCADYRNGITDCSRCGFDRDEAERRSGAAKKDTVHHRSGRTRSKNHREERAMSDTVVNHKESYYQAKIIKWLKTEYPDAFIWKAQAGPYSRQGIPDICAIINGHFFGFEVKRPDNGHLSPVQAQTIKQINAAGGTALVVSYPEQAKEAIDKWKISLTF